MENQLPEDYQTIRFDLQRILAVVKAMLDGAHAQGATPAELETALAFHFFIMHRQKSKDVEEAMNQLFTTLEANKDAYESTYNFLDYNHKMRKYALNRGGNISG